MGKIPIGKIPIPKPIGKIDGSSFYLDGNNVIIYKDGSGEILQILPLPSLIDTSKMITYFERKVSPVSNTAIKNILDMVDVEFESIEKKPNKKDNSDKGEKLEKPYFLPNELFEMVDFTKLGVVKEAKTHMPQFIKGEKYELSGVECEGFEMPSKIYELVGVHDEYDGININSVIVKQIGGEQDKIFTLSKNDCEHIGIEYEKGLQLFPKHLNWKRVKDVIPFDKNDMGTTPLSDIDNTIRYALVKINGFKDYVDGYVQTPSGKLIREKQFEDSLKIVSNEPIVYGNGIVVQENTIFRTEIVYPDGLLYKFGNFISEENTIYVLIDFTKPCHDNTSIDGYCGVERTYLNGFNANEHFEIYWDELGAYTVEEYEAEKARQEKARQERIAREEKERQRKIEEEERRIKEQRKRVDTAISRMKEMEIAMPKFPKMPNMLIDGLGSISLYTDCVDTYFNNLDNTLNKLSTDLSKMSKTLGINLDKIVTKNSVNSALFDMFNL